MAGVARGCVGSTSYGCLCPHGVYWGDRYQGGWVLEQECFGLLDCFKGCSCRCDQRAGSVLNKLVDGLHGIGKQPILKPFPNRKDQRRHSYLHLLLDLIIVKNLTHLTTAKTQQILATNRLMDQVTLHPGPIFHPSLKPPTNLTIVPLKQTENPPKAQSHRRTCQEPLQEPKEKNTDGLLCDLLVDCRQR